MKEIKLPQVRPHKSGLHDLFLKAMAKAMNMTKEDVKKLFR